MAPRTPLAIRVWPSGPSTEMRIGLIGDHTDFRECGWVWDLSYIHFNSTTSRWLAAVTVFMDMGRPDPGGLVSGAKVRALKLRRVVRGSG